MRSALWLLAIAGAIALVGTWALTRRHRLKQEEQAWLPEELKTARLEFAERTFYTRWPFRLYAKIDRAYRTQDGSLVLTELKRRFRRQAYPSDVVELSAQKLAIERGARYRVAAKGFVVVEHPGTGERTPIAVTLLPEAEIVALGRRHRLLVDAIVAPDKLNDARLCRSCAYVDRCRPDAVRDPRTPPMNASPAIVRQVVASAQTIGISAAAATTARAARRQKTGRNPGRSTTRARNSPGSGQSHKT